MKVVQVQNKMAHRIFIQDLDSVHRLKAEEGNYSSAHLFHSQFHKKIGIYFKQKFSTKKTNPIQLRNKNIPLGLNGNI